MHRQCLDREGLAVSLLEWILPLTVENKRFENKLRSVLRTATNIRAVCGGHSRPDVTDVRHSASCITLTIHVHMQRNYDYGEE